MAVFKCKLCGGAIEPKDNGIGICDSCGTKQTISNTNDEKKMNLLDRANHFRIQNDFDKAMAIYEQILDEDTTDSDVYYSLALCRYGITYVDDPKTNKKIPTINRLQNNRFTEDTDFEMAIKYAEPEQKKLYGEEGMYIDKVQQGIMDITKNEKPYDVFICYKETDDNGERTHDSVLANELYHELTNEGFKVFFARITLEGKLGTAYEPYIFSALNSSKVMVVIGTKKEYLNSVWVKNEWSRFIRLINEGVNKTLIPAYRDMDPYDLPDEFANLQAQDMSKLGFMQDLIRGIKKILSSKEVDRTKDLGSGNEKVTSLLKRVKVFLEDGDFDKADEYCEKALDIDAENSDIYLYKLLAETHCANVNKLKQKKEDLNEYKSYKNAFKFGSEKQKQGLDEIRKENTYNIAEDLLSKEDYCNAIKEYKKIIDFKESKEKVSICQDIIYKQALDDIKNKEYNIAAKKFETIDNYMDSKERVKECDDLNNQSIYEKGIELLNNKYYDGAITEFNRIPDYLDSNEKLKECIYASADEHMSLNNYSKALERFCIIIDYNDSREKALECFKKTREKSYDNRYLEAVELANQAKYNQAKVIFRDMLDLWGSKDHYMQLYYRKDVEKDSIDEFYINIIRGNSNYNINNIYFAIYIGEIEDPKKNGFAKDISILHAKDEEIERINKKNASIAKVIIGILIIAFGLRSCGFLGGSSSMGGSIFGFIVIFVGISVCCMKL